MNQVVHCIACRARWVKVYHATVYAQCPYCKHPNDPKHPIIQGSQAGSDQGSQAVPGF